MFEYNITKKHYHTLDYYLKSKYNKKVFKVPLNASFTCPNRDGKKGTGGCIFCSDGARSNELKDIKDLEEQYQTLKKIMSNKCHLIVFQLISCTDQFSSNSVPVTAAANGFSRNALIVFSTMP